MAGLVVILGPAPCHLCRTLLVWDGRAWRLGNGGWHAHCLTDDELAAWREVNAVLHRSVRATAPCVDCTPEYAAVADGCNGTPGRQPGGRRRLPAEEARSRQRTSWRESKRRARAAA